MQEPSSFTKKQLRLREVEGVTHRTWRPSAGAPAMPAPRAGLSSSMSLGLLDGSGDYWCLCGHLPSRPVSGLGLRVFTLHLGRGVGRTSLCIGDTEFSHPPTRPTVIPGKCWRWEEDREEGK